MRVVAMVLLVVLAAVPASAAVPPPVEARGGMVVTAHPLATRVGVEVLEEGGNALDAAVAVGLALAVVLPRAGNLGGGGFMMLLDASSGRVRALDFRETAPLAARRGMYLDAAGRPVPGASLYGYKAAGVPGSVAGLAAAHAAGARLPWRRLVAPAIRLARRGFAADRRLAALLAVKARELWPFPANRQVFFRGRRPLATGELLVQEDLSRSLELIAREGSAAFYRGEIARRIVAAMKANRGLMTMEDLAAYRARFREPVTGTYRRLRVHSMPPPSSGGIALVQLLNVLEPFRLRRLGFLSADSIHLIVEAARRIYADRSRHLGDADFHPVPVRWLTSRAYAGRIARAVDPLRATPSAAVRPGKPLQGEGDQTTHYSIVDRHGNAVAVTTTLNSSFGSKAMVPGTGILLNNEMDDFSIKPGVPNQFGLVGGEANAIAPGKRMLSSMTPTIVTRQGKPFLVLGSPGGSAIITSVLQVILGVVEYEVGLARALCAPRIHHQWLPDVLFVERDERYGKEVLDALRARGHRISRRDPLGRVQAIAIGKGGVRLGYADPRGIGTALGHD